MILIRNLNVYCRSVYKNLHILACIACQVKNFRLVLLQMIPLTSVMITKLKGNECTPLLLMSHRKHTADTDYSGYEPDWKHSSDPSSSDNEHDYDLKKKNMYFHVNQMKILSQFMQRPCAKRNNKMEKFLAE